jgi:hypothetical protein
VLGSTGRAAAPPSPRRALDDDRPSYYGAALVALTRTMLERDALGGC